MLLVDSHCHIYLNEFNADREAVIINAENEGIRKIVMPAIDIENHASMLRTEEFFPGICLSMMGLHPCSVKETLTAELKAVQDYLETRKFYAIGETGLDFYWDLTFTKEQYRALYQQIEWALHFNLPIVIHSRNSIDECIRTISERQNGNLKGIFHCFSGDLSQANKIIELGFYLGIGGVITFKNAGLDIVMEQIDLDHVVLETDAPYLAPVPFRGKRNETAYLKYVVQKLADVKQISIDEVAEITTANAEKIFALQEI